MTFVLTRSVSLTGRQLLPQNRKAPRLKLQFHFGLSLIAIMTSSPAAASPGSIAAEIDAAFVAQSREGGPGCSAALYRNGQLEHATSFGKADIESGRPIDADTIFNIASDSKQFTAVAILLLSSRGALSLDDSIRRFIPEMGGYAQGVTVGQLLHHTGGLRDYVTLAQVANIGISDRFTEKDALDLLGRQQGADFAPGTEHAYSNSGYFLLSIVVERVSGQTMKEFAERNIFGPLQMQNSSYVDRYPAGIAQLARGYSPAGTSWSIDETGWEMTGDGQVHTSIRDLAKWERAMISGEIGGKDVLAQMLTPGRTTDGRTLTYAGGVQLGQYRGLDTVSHSGGWAGYASHIVRFPAHRVAIAVFCNRSDAEPTEYALRIADIALRDYLGAVEIEQPDPALVARAGVDASQAIAGLYGNEHGDIVEITRQGGQTSIATGRSTAAVVAHGGNVFRLAPDNALFLVFPTKRMLVLASDDAPFRLLTPGTPVGSKVPAGAYFSAEVNGTINVKPDGPGLKVQIGDEEVAFRPATTDRYFSPRWGSLAVLDDGRLQLRSGGMRMLTFEPSASGAKIGSER